LLGGKFLRTVVVPALLVSSSALILVSHSRTSGASTAAAASNHGTSRLGVGVEGSSRKDYVGDAACKACHQGVESTYEHTAHHLTSRLPNKGSLVGKFAPGSNTMPTLDPNLHFVMSSGKGGYFETAVFGKPPDEVKQTERIDLVVGSGERGETYLYWKGDRLFELPVTFWTPLNEWTNSPGYRDGTADFDRPVVPRCLECHATYFSAIPSEAPANRYHKAGSVLGISCERCHGPGREHVELEKAAAQHAQKTPGSADAGSGEHRSDAQNGAQDLKIVNPEKLSRDRQIDVCAECHAGLGEDRAPAFSFVPGQVLSEYLEVQPLEPNAKVDVHGNQVALLERSRCFRSSTKITCNFCHDVHTRERSAASYSDRCLTCHKVESCGLYPKLGQELAKNCIDCHMPVQDSNLIVSNVGGKEIKMRIRNHWIKVYADAAGQQ